MGKSNYKLAMQHRGRAYYAEIELEIDILPCTDVKSTGLYIHFIENSENEWKSAVIFGVTYAWEKVEKGMQEYRVTIRSVRGHVVDTTQMVMAFAAMNAFWEAIDEEPITAPRLDSETGVFLVPK